jgi:DNA sulfur modification protein DndD
MKVNCNHCCTKIDKLTVKIDNNKILDNVSLHLHCNEITMLVGKNGAGKTSLLKAIKYGLFGCFSLGLKNETANYYKEIREFINNKADKNYNIEI